MSRLKDSTVSAPKKIRSRVASSMIDVEVCGSVDLNSVLETYPLDHARAF
jgi:hypothetical protein